MFLKIKRALILLLFGSVCAFMIMLLWAAVLVLSGERADDLWLAVISILTYELFGYILAARQKKEAERDAAIALAQAIKDGTMRYDGPTPRKEAE
jgi:cbb3-type cytochrome oxidase subunit 3